MRTVKGLLILAERLQLQNLSQREDQKTMSDLRPQTFAPWLPQALARRRS
jgi:hypothetical protein